jgi:ribosomal-protein-alanine N-acetyltransferase
MKAPARVETARLLLRWLVLADANSIYSRYASDAEVTRFLGWPRHRSIDDTRTFIQLSDAQWCSYAAGPYLIESRCGLLLGSTGLEIKTARQAATGYVLARDAWGRGYATESVLAMIGVARKLSIRELHAICHAEHTVSHRVLRKCGFTCKADTRAEFPNLSPGASPGALRYELVID